MSDTDDLYYQIRDRLIGRWEYLNESVFRHSVSGSVPDAVLQAQAVIRRDEMDHCLSLMAREKGIFTKAQRRRIASAKASKAWVSSHL